MATTSLASDAVVTLFSAQRCPYAHRTRLVLTHKGVPFALEEIDLDNKPSFFRDLGYGKVPLIEHAGARIWESAIINEYLNEVFPDPPLLPPEARERARARIWIDWANSRFADPFLVLLRGTSAKTRAEASTHFAECLAFLERDGLGRSAGPYFSGRTPSLVDFSLHPWFERLVALRQVRGPKLVPELSQPIARWFAALADLPAVAACASPPEFYAERYARYAARPDVPEP
jgi:glutathione S-transferase